MVAAALVSAVIVAATAHAGSAPSVFYGVDGKERCRVVPYAMNDWTFPHDDELDVWARHGVIWGDITHFTAGGAVRRGREWRVWSGRTLVGVVTKISETHASARRVARTFGSPDQGWSLGPVKRGYAGYATGPDPVVVAVAVLLFGRC